MKEINKVLFVSDLHIPFNVELDSLFTDIKKNNYDMIVLGGDIVDFKSPSRFDKSPSEIGTLQQELNEYYKFMNKLRKLFKGQLIYLVGNHEIRVDKYLKSNHELHGLKSLQLKNLLKSKEYNFTLMDKFMFKEMLFTHGDYCTKYTPAKELDVKGVSGISGHTHTHQVFTKRTLKGNNIWITAPCMQDINQQVYSNSPNWNYGWVVLNFNKQKIERYEVVLK